MKGLAQEIPGAPRPWGGMRLGLCRGGTPLLHSQPVHSRGCSGGENEGKSLTGAGSAVRVNSSQ